MIEFLLNIFNVIFSFVGVLFIFTAIGLYYLFKE